MIDKLIQLSKIFKEGFTIEVNNGSIQQYNNTNKPYVVSYKTLIVINADKNKVFYDNLKIPDKCIIGGWSNIENGGYYIELNKVYANKQYALKIAKKYHQKAIYNSITGDTINV